MNPVAPASGDAQLLSQLSTTDYNPDNYLSGTAPIAPLSPIVMLLIAGVLVWVVYGKH